MNIVIPLVSLAVIVGIHTLPFISGLGGRCGFDDPAWMQRHVHLFDEGGWTAGVYDGPSADGRLQ